MENSRYHRFTWDDLNEFVTFLGHVFLGHMFWNAVTQRVTSRSVMSVKPRSQMAFEPYEIMSFVPNFVAVRLLSVITY